MAESQQPGVSYVCVRVTGFDDKDAQGIVVDIFDDSGKADDYAREHPGVVAVPYKGDLVHKVGDEGLFPLNLHPGIPEQVRELKRLQENKREVLVAKWDGHNGPPREGMNAIYDLGRDGLNRLRERIARSPGRIDHPTDKTFWVAIERYPGVTNEGKIVGISPIRQEAEMLADRREQKIIEQRKAIEPKALERESFGPSLHQFRMDLG